MISENIRERMPSMFRKPLSTLHNRFRIFNARRKSLPGIILNTLPKSASVYIWNQISIGFNMPRYTIHIGHFPDSLLAPSLTKELARGGLVAQSHFPAKKHNLLTLYRAGIERLIVHIRDPRQSLLSWVHHLKQRNTPFHPELIGLDIMPPKDYFDFPLKDLITWHIENYLPQQVKWIEGWLDAIEDPPWKNLKILMTQFEDFKKNQDAFFDSILNFCEIDKLDFKISTNHTPKPGKLHFRKGKPDEWRDVFTAEQSHSANEIIPERLFKTFDWPQ